MRLKTRSDKIRKFARGKDCTMRIDGGVCNHNPETTVFAHAPFPGRGGTRNHDYWGAFLCSDCHDYVDGRTTHVQRQYGELWHNAIRETLLQLIEADIVVLK